MMVETDRLLLKKLSPEDAPELYNYRSNHDVYRYQTWLPETVEDALRFIQNFPLDGEWIPGQWKQMGIYLKDDGKLIGDIGIYVFDVTEVELGFSVSPPYQHKGYAKEAVTAVINMLCFEREIVRFRAVTDPENTSSIALLEKLGFELSEHKIHSTEIRGEMRDDLIYKLRM